MSNTQQCSFKSEVTCSRVFYSLVSMNCSQAHVQSSAGPGGVWLLQELGFGKAHQPEMQEVPIKDIHACINYVSAK